MILPITIRQTIIRLVFTQLRPWQAESSYALRFLEDDDVFGEAAAAVLWVGLRGLDAGLVAAGPGEEFVGAHCCCGW